MVNPVVPPLDINSIIHIPENKECENGIATEITFSETRSPGSPQSISATSEGMGVEHHIFNQFRRRTSYEAKMSPRSNGLLRMDDIKDFRKINKAIALFDRLSYPEAEKEIVELYKTTVKKLREDMILLCLKGEVEKIKEESKMKVAVDTIQHMHICCDLFLTDCSNAMKSQLNLANELPCLAMDCMESICNIAGKYWRASTVIKRSNRLMSRSERTLSHVPGDSSLQTAAKLFYSDSAPDLSLMDVDL